MQGIFSVSSDIKVFHLPMLVHFQSSRLKAKHKVLSKLLMINLIQNVERIESSSVLHKLPREDMLA